MGTSLTGTTPQDTYDSLIKVTDNGPLGSTPKYLSDGLGTDSALSLSTANIGIGNDAPTQKLHVTGNIRVTGAYYDSTNSAGSAGQVLKSTGTGVEWGAAATGVTSVGLSAPTGFSVSGSPVTSSGTLALSFASGYSLPTTANQTNWTTAYNDSIVSAAVAGTTTKTLTLTQQDGGTITASWSDYDTAPVTSVNGQTGAVVLDTDDISEGVTNLYYTNARSRAALSAGTGITYDNSTGVITNAAPDKTVALTAGTGISTSGTYPNFTITNTDPDKVVSLTSGTGISATGTYPNFTIDNTAPDKVVSLTGGTAISTSGTYPNFTIDNTAPDKVVSLTGGTAISTSGTYPNFTIDNTAPDKVVALSAGTGISVSGTYPNFGIANTDLGSALNLSGGTGISISGSYPNLTINNTGPTGSNPSGTSFITYWKNSSMISPTSMYWDNMNGRLGMGTLYPQQQFVISSFGNSGIEFAGFNGFWGNPSMAVYNRSGSYYENFTIEAGIFRVYNGSWGQSTMMIDGGSYGGVFSMDGGGNWYGIYGGYIGSPQICTGFVTMVINGTPYKIMIA